ncbi:transcriptional regulator with XRE-family HTH domain [Nocardiopsis mwathae]|uniref:Transcriptional regulator with XRE-family HTH domain n=1 Tax=Nocardiopsis mwathae TaxID=1472723 RepID=A0A7X0D6I7_9ACTN|nr:helix-turn-helix transcriptional regulator [Nocardiopsis mwathae]MBB6173582.1 transcriptional regulator with XRE-family HTH domain [Nocardiopsis mwathae]
MANEIPVRRRHLITRLKQLRLSSGLTQDDVSGAMGWDRGKIHRLEQGRFKRINAADVVALCGLYKASDEEKDALAEIAKQSRKSSWWYRYSDVFAGPFIGLEAEALTIEGFNNSLVPGLFQVPEYIQALIEPALDVTVPRDEVQTRIDVRLQRQRSVLDRKNPPHIWLILDESVLRRQVGGVEVMRTQVRHLREMTERPTIDIQVLPFSAGAHAASGFQFTTLGFEGSDRVVYIETDRDGLYLEEPEQIRRYTLVFDRLQATAMSVEDSARFMDAVVS